MLIVTALPLLVMLSLFCYVPESPRYLLAKGEQDKAVAIVAKIADYNNTTLPNGSLHGRQKSKVEQQEQQSTLCEKSTEIFFVKNQHDTILLLVHRSFTCHSQHAYAARRSSITTMCAIGTYGNRGRKGRQERGSSYR